VFVNSLPLIRHSERVDYKRCPKKWFWRWRMGLVPKAKTFGALELGTWFHSTLAAWYSQPDREGLSLTAWFKHFAELAIGGAKNIGAPDYTLEKADELAALGEAMATAYQKKYGADPAIIPIVAEIPLEFDLTDADGKVFAKHKLKPDLVYREAANPDYVWLMEHKTAAQIRTEHLVIDDQARPYGAMAEISLRRAGVLRKSDVFKGIMYNFVRKALTDERPVNEQGQSLNKNGSVSAKQPVPTLMRFPVTLTKASKRIAISRLRIEAGIITGMTEALRSKKVDPALLPKTPHSSCPKLCPFFTMCVVEEQGGDIKEMQRTMYERRDPYLYEEESTEVLTSFELS
jgi:hypothetical protein